MVPRAPTPLPPPWLPPPQEPKTQYLHLEVFDYDTINVKELMRVNVLKVCVFWGGRVWGV